MSPQKEVLDLYSCAGGMTRGLQRAGFRVTGVDIVARPEYPGEGFYRADAVAFVLENLNFIRSRFAFVHASPPCQAEGAPAKGTNKAKGWGGGFQRLIGPTREVLELLGLPYIIENVAGSTVRKDLMLCGDHFGLPIIMHRYFEFGGGLPVPPPPYHPDHSPKHDNRHGGRRVRGWRHQEVIRDGYYLACYGKGGGKASVAEMQAAKGIDWTDEHLALREAIPPAYGQYIGEHVQAWLRTRERVA